MNDPVKRVQDKSLVENVFKSYIQQKTYMHNDKDLPNLNNIKKTNNPIEK